MRISFGKPTWRGVYAHALLLTFYFLLIEGVVMGVIGGVITGSILGYPISDYMKILGFALMTALLVPLLKNTFPELKHWFVVHFVFMFFLLLFIRMYMMRVYGV